MRRLFVKYALVLIAVVIFLMPDAAHARKAYEDYRTTQHRENQDYQRNNRQTQQDYQRSQQLDRQTHQQTLRRDNDNFKRGRGMNN